MNQRGPRPRRRARWAPLLAGCLLVLGSCGSDDASSPDDGSPGTSDERTVATGPVPLTEVSLSDLEEASDEIATLLSFYEGGDNPCGGLDDDVVLDEPEIVDTAFRTMPDVQIGWSYTICWVAEPLDGFELLDPDGTPLPEGEYDSPFPLPPGSPLGTYRAKGQLAGQRFEADIEVVPARDARLLRDPRSASFDPIECDDVVRTYLVGFTDVDVVEVAIYEQDPDAEIYPPESALIGSFDVPVDDDGSASLEVGPGDSTGERRFSIVADPVQANERWYMEPAEPRDELMTLGFNQQLAVDACFAG